MKARNIILIIGAISFIAFSILLSLLLAEKFNVTSCGCQNVVEKNFAYIFVVLSAVFIGSLIYFLLSLKIDYQSEIIEKNVSLVLSFLDSEKKVLKEIIDAKGSILQSKITEKFGKLKSHRILRKLKEKGIIDIKQDGKTNRILLKEQLKRELVK